MSFITEAFYVSHDFFELVISWTYTKIFEFENVKLKFQREALKAVAREAIKRRSGARGLRAILEDVMLEIMYDIPSQENVKECVVSEEVILKKEKPIILYENKTKSA